MHIHFVCSGNAYRSRLAEAYFRSKISDSSVVASSSGIEANKHHLNNGPICWYAMRLMKRHDLIPFMSWREHQTTKSSLKNVDLLICLHQDHLDFCKHKLGYKGSYEVWHLPDLNQLPEFIPSTQPGIETDINHIQLTEQTFALITQKVDNLLRRIP